MNLPPGSRLGPREHIAPPGASASSDRVARAALWPGLGLLCLLLLADPGSAQDLEPRAYAHVAVNATFLVSGFSLSHGGVLTDPTLPVTDISATVAMPSLGVARSFSLFGKTAQAFGGLPCSWVQVSGNALGVATDIRRAGLADMHIRLSVLVRGAPAASVLQIVKAPRRTIVGASLSVVAPTGQFSSNTLINLGTNRWSLKPEFAVSQPLGQRWLLDAYAGLWLFTANNSFYPGTLVRTQAPLAAFQAHVSYSLNRQMWAAFDTTYYGGGRTTVQGVANHDQQSNARLGATFVVPIARRYSVKLALSKGAIVRYGANFTTFSIGLQTGWAPRPRPSQ